MTKKSYRPGWRSSESRGTNKMSSMSSKLRILLPIAIVAILLSVFLWPKFERLITSINQGKQLDKILKANPQLENKVIHPKLDSIDKKGRPFLIEAEFATNVNENKSEFHKPNGYIKLDDGSTLSFNSDLGYYAKQEEMVELRENVNIKTDKGYDLKTSYMKLYPKDNLGEGDQPIKGVGPSRETIEAEGFKITNKGDIIEFLGKTKITLPGTQ